MLERELEMSNERIGGAVLRRIKLFGFPISLVGTPAACGNETLHGRQRLLCLQVSVQGNLPNGCA